ncbi:hypothetical protein [Shewanella sp. Isolate11]|uniref:hypothetical protein n=1 Tax=Shewanella sp. Isolate11 TaxID=2908530 RepID=UPI001EFEC6CD|nr:hypothetical protein [Shewanella sp. Isolate11]MCG9695798.1 hypothetical protein [Shewanella sp. Isolate11]
MLVEIFTLLLAIALLLFMFKHRLVQFRIKPAQKNTTLQRKPVPITDKPPVAQPVNLSSTHPYHSVEIVDDTGKCKNALTLKGKRYLSQEAPTLPLFGCKNSDCRCHYIHFEDRRNDNKGRRVDYGVTHELYGVFGEKNRRGIKAGGRRITDT